MILEPISIYNKQRVDEYLCSVIYQPLTDALYEMTKVKPNEPIEWLADYMLRHNKNKPLIHGVNPQAVQNLMDLKEKEEIEENRKRIKPDVPAKCGCYLSESDSNVSATSRNWSGK